MIIFIIFIFDVIMFTSIYMYNLCIPIPILYLWYIIFKIFEECRFTNVHIKFYYVMSTQYYYYIINIADRGMMSSVTAQEQVI